MAAQEQVPGEVAAAKREVVEVEVGIVLREAGSAEHGGAPLLGVKGVCIITHGRSNANAIKNAIRVAKELAGGKIAHQTIVQAWDE